MMHEMPILLPYESLMQFILLHLFISTNLKHYVS